MAASPPVSRAPAPLRLVVMGVSGAGKSTVAAALVGRFGLAYVDGDDLYPPANVDRIRSGVAIDDADRWPRLDLVAAALADADRVVLACSALKRAYRDHIRARAPPDLRFVFRDVAAADVTDRLRARSGHFMPRGLMDSQFAALDLPGSDEADVLTVAVVRPVHEIGQRFAAATHTGA